MNGKKIIMCGGDMRSVYMANFFKERGFDVSACFIDDEILKSEKIRKTDLSGDFSGADALVFGLPATMNGMVYAPLSKGENFADVLRKFSKDTLVCGARFKDADISLAKGFDVFDYSEDETFKLENAVYTAEGALEAVIKNTSRSLGEMSVFVGGYGRIARVLSGYLKNMGSRVTVYARRAEVRDEAKSQGLFTVENAENLGDYDVIINTAPAKIFKKVALAEVKKDALIVDLSARPGYVSKDDCENLNLNLIFLPGLPSVCAPRSAGEAAGRAVLRKITQKTEGDVV